MKHFQIDAYRFRMPADGKKHEPTKLAAREMPQTSVKGIHVDEALKKTRKLFEGAGFKVRSISASPGNKISIVVLP